MSLYVHGHTTAIAIGLCLAIGAAFAIAPVVEAPTAAARADVLVIEHTPEGQIERTGFLSAFRYDGHSMQVEFVDDGDALFHNGFDPPQ